MKYQPTSESIALQEAPLPVHGSKATRPRPEFREMFFDIWTARARTKLQNLGSERGMTSRPEASGLDAAGGKGSALGALTAMLRLTLGRLPRVLPTLVTRSRPIIRAAAISATGVSVAHIFKPSALCMPLTAAAAADDEDPIEAVLADELAVQASDDSEVEDAADIEYNRLYSLLIRPSCSSKPYNY